MYRLLKKQSKFKKRKQQSGMKISVANQLDIANIQKEVEINESLALEETKRIKLIEETKIHEINFKEKACQ